MIFNIELLLNKFHARYIFKIVHVQATGSWDYAVRLWNLQDESVKILDGHKGNVHTVAFSKEGMLVSNILSLTVFIKRSTLIITPGILNHCALNKKALWIMDFNTTT